MVTSPPESGREGILLARRLPLILIVLAALVLPSGVLAQTDDPVLVSNADQTAGSDLATAAGRASYAQSFTTGDHPDGYFLSSVEVGLAAATGVTAKVELWWSDRSESLARVGRYHYPDHFLTTLSGPSAIDNDASTLERFSEHDVLLLPATTYWIVVTRTGGGDDGLSVGTTSSEGAIDVAGMAGFSVGNNVWARNSSGMPDGTGGWTDYTGSLDASMKIRLRGSEATRPPGPYTTNRNQQTRAAAAETGASTTRYATSFSTRSLQLFAGRGLPHHLGANLGVAERGGGTGGLTARRDPRGRRRVAGGDPSDERHADRAGKHLHRSRQARPGRVHCQLCAHSRKQYQVLGGPRCRLRVRQAERQHNRKRSDRIRGFLADTLTARRGVSVRR